MNKKLFVLLAAGVLALSACKKEEAAPAAPAPPSDEVVLLKEIRDLLKK